MDPKNTGEDPNLFPELKEEQKYLLNFIKENRGFMIFESILLIILGSLAVMLPVFSTFALEILIGSLLALAGIVQLIRAFTAKDSPAFLATLISGLIYAAVGALLLAYPLTGVITLTILLLTLYLVQGGAQIAMAFQMRHAKGWGWLLLSGLVTLGLAVIIGTGFPSTAMWVMGLLTGINLIFFGFALLAVVLASNKPQPPISN